MLKGMLKYYNDDEQNVEYDFYNLNGSYSSEVLKMYADNKTINSDKLHLDYYFIQIII
ncbi:exotoxin beta-grasp domain-containing protein [Staphylococcus aureus]